jgi:IS30 family transposase
MNKKDVKSRISNVRHFTKNEEKFLLDNYEIMSVSEIAVELNRTKESVYNKAKRLGISKTAYKRKPSSKKRQRLSLQQLKDFILNDIYELHEEKYFIAVVSQGILIAKLKAYVE